MSHTRFIDYSPLVTDDYRNALNSALAQLDESSDAALYTPDVYAYLTLILGGVQLLTSVTAPWFSVAQMLLAAANALIVGVTSKVATTAYADVLALIDQGVSANYFNTTPTTPAQPQLSGFTIDEEAKTPSATAIPIPSPGDDRQLQIDAMKVTFLSTASEYIDYSAIATPEFKNQLASTYSSLSAANGAITYTPYTASFGVAVASAFQIAFPSATPAINFFGQVCVGGGAAFIKSVASKVANTARTSAAQIIVTGVSRGFFNTAPVPPTVAEMALDRSSAKPSTSGMWSQSAANYRKFVADAVQFRILGMRSGA